MSASDASVLPVRYQATNKNFLFSVAFCVGLIALTLIAFAMFSQAGQPPRAVFALMLVVPPIASIYLVITFYQAALTRAGKNFVEVSVSGLRISQSGRAVEVPWQSVAQLEHLPNAIGLVFDPEFAKGKVLWNHNMQKTGFHYKLVETYEVGHHELFQVMHKAWSACSNGD